MRKLGLYIRSERISAQISMRKLAETLGISHVYLGQIERGEAKILPEKYWSTLIDAVPNISRQRLQELAELHLNLDLSDKTDETVTVALALSRRIEKDDITGEERRKLMQILGFSEESIFE